jgi:hypothetical protein
MPVLVHRDAGLRPRTLLESFIPLDKRRSLALHLVRMTNM